MVCLWPELHQRRFNPWREAPPRATTLSAEYWREPLVSIPGGKPLHEPRQKGTAWVMGTDAVSIPGGKPLHEPRDSRRGVSAYHAGFQSLAGSPSTSHKK